MIPSTNIETFIKGFEQLRLKAYMPTPDDVPTIGYGHTKGVKMGDVCSSDQANLWFSEDLENVAAPIDKALVNHPTTQYEFDAMTSLAYNIGLGAFLGSSVFKRHIASDTAGAAQAFLLWNKQKGKVLNGLVARRVAEAAIYTNVNYSRGQE